MSADARRILTNIVSALKRLASQRERIYIIREVIQDLEGQIGKTIPLEDVQRIGQEKGMTTAEIEEIIEKLKRSGDIYEPRYGFVARV